MIREAITRLFGAAPEPGQPSRLPPELVHAIGASNVVFRPSRTEDGAERVHVKMPTVGSFEFDGIGDAAERIGKAWPEITPQQARHAAHLLGGAITKLFMLQVRGPRYRRPVPKCLRPVEYDIDQL